MITDLGAITLLVDDYDKALDYYVDTLGFNLIEDTKLSSDKRWVLLSPSATSTTKLLLAKAQGEAQVSAIGNQSGGRVFLFLHSDDFENDYKTLHSKGVLFLEPPRHESYGSVAVFQDIYGNKWDLIQPH